RHPSSCGSHPHNADPDERSSCLVRTHDHRSETFPQGCTRPARSHGSAADDGLPARGEGCLRWARLGVVVAGGTSSFQSLPAIERSPIRVRPCAALPSDDVQRTVDPWPWRLLRGERSTLYHSALNLTRLLFRFTVRGLRAAGPSG